MLEAYADEHVPLAIVRGLRIRGMDVTSVTELGRQGTDDEVLLEQATDERRIMLTCDTDFLRQASALYSENRAFAPIVFWPQQERRIGHVIRAVIRLATTYGSARANFMNNPGPFTANGSSTCYDPKGNEVFLGGYKQ